jgi:hypothetical protein
MANIKNNPKKASRESLGSSKRQSRAVVVAGKVCNWGETLSLSLMDFRKQEDHVCCAEKFEGTCFKEN